MFSCKKNKLINSDSETTTTTFEERNETVLHQNILDALDLYPIRRIFISKKIPFLLPSFFLCHSFLDSMKTKTQVAE